MYEPYEPPERDRTGDVVAGGSGLVGNGNGGRDAVIVRTVIAVIVAVIGIAIVAGVAASADDAGQREKEAWDECIAEERQDLADRESLLEPEDLCEIGHDNPYDD